MSRLIGRTLLVVLGIMLCLPQVLKAVSFTYNVNVDTALYKGQVFATTITGTVVTLSGIIFNEKFPISGGSKVASIDFGLANGNTSESFDLVLDSVFVRVQKYTYIPPPGDDRQWSDYSKIDMTRISAANINWKECYKFRVTLDYPHTDNGASYYRVQFKIFGSYE